LSVDTPENRFIKFVITDSISKLSKINRAVNRMQANPEKQRISKSFFDKLEKWQKDMRYYQRKSVFREVGNFSGFSKESLVLQQKLGYAKVYRVWQQLKWYLNFLEGDSNLSLRSVAELYEVWCFLEVRRILLGLGFREIISKQNPMVNKGVEVSFKDGMLGAFMFDREDGVSIRLAHEPVFKRDGNPIRSWVITQKPDIYLEATFPDDGKIVWVFDAKYRIKDTKTSKLGSADSIDFVPDDAINQMHRYRDALIRQMENEQSGVVKSKPVFGAYALYPGFYDQKNSSENPYSEAIEEVGIGAFSLLPASDHSGSIWLTKFLTEKLTFGSIVSADRYFVEEAPRIPYHGSKVTRVEGLVVAANQLGPSRESEYVTKFATGAAEFYHVKQFAFERQRIEHHIVREIMYISVAVDTLPGARQIDFVYPVLSAKKIKRCEITRVQSGIDSVSNPEEVYWLFELGKSLKLRQSISLGVDPHFKLKFVELKELVNGQEWGVLHEHYDSM